MVTFRAAIGPTPQATPQVTPQATPQVVAVLTAALTPKERQELQDAVGLKDREHFRKTYLEPLVAAGWLEMSLPDKPTSPRQKYTTSAAGKQVLAENA